MLGFVASTQPTIFPETFGQIFWSQWPFDRKRSPPPTFPPVKVYSAFQIDELHPHNQNLVGTFHATSLLWSTDIKTAYSPVLRIFCKLKVKYFNLKFLKKDVQDILGYSKPV